MDTQALKRLRTKVCNHIHGTIYQHPRYARLILSPFIEGGENITAVIRHWTLYTKPNIIRSFPISKQRSNLLSTMDEYFSKKGEIDLKRFLP